MTTKLNALVAKHVMGALEVHFNEDWGKWAATFNNEWFDPCLPYSTDIAEAWKVAEKMDELGWRISLYRGTYGFQGKFKYEVVFSMPVEQGGTPYGHGYAVTPSMAICRAALEAFGVTEE